MTKTICPICATTIAVLHKPSQCECAHKVCFSTCSASCTQSLRSSLGSLSSLNFVTTCDAKGLGKASAVFASGAGTCTFIATLSRRFHSPTPHSCGARQTSQQKCSIASTAGPVAIAESTAIRAITGQMSLIGVCSSRHPFSRTIKRSPLLVVSERLAPLLPTQNGRASACGSKEPETKTRNDLWLHLGHRFLIAEKPIVTKGCTQFANANFCSLAS